MFKIYTKSWFTLVEILISLVIVWILFVGLTVTVQPYLSRSRDTKRVTSLFQYTPIIESYEKNFDTFPSNYGRGWNGAALWYCLSELPTRGNVIGLWNEWKFATLLGESSVPPKDPGNTTVSPCDIPGSFLYIKHNIGPSREIFILAASLETQTSANYGTGSELLLPINSESIIKAQKWSVPITAPDQLFVVSKLR